MEWNVMTSEKKKPIEQNIRSGGGGKHLPLANLHEMETTSELSGSGVNTAGMEWNVMTIGERKTNNMRGNDYLQQKPLLYLDENVIYVEFEALERMPCDEKWKKTLQLLRNVHVKESEINVHSGFGRGNDETEKN
jgi:hypothetical protein